MIYNLSYINCSRIIAYLTNVFKQINATKASRQAEGAKIINMVFANKSMKVAA
jgi:hypothetical protein